MIQRNVGRDMGEGGVCKFVIVCDKGGGGVKICRKKRDVLYGRSLKPKIVLPYIK